MTANPDPMKPYDVLVAGAGPAGLCAAIQVARAGGSCLLVEKSGLLGGATTTGGVNFPGLFHAWGRQVIAGIGWELVVRAVREFDGIFPDFKDDERPHHKRQVLVDRFTYAAVADAMVEESGARLLLHTMPVRAAQAADGCWQVELAGKEGPQTIRARVLIDATGDANLASIAGLRTRRNAALQPGTLVFQAGGYELADIDMPLLIEAARAAAARGEVRATDFGGRPEWVEALLRNQGGNIIHITGIDARTSAGKTEAETKGRAALLRLQHFFRGQPGLRNFQVVSFAPECGIRETVTIDGEVEISAGDYGSGRSWPDSVCYSFYPIDVHEDDGGGIDMRPLRPGTYPSIPLRALIPRGSRNFLVAGRIACGDKEANSAFRVQASCMAMGQAAGAAAVQAARSGQDVRDLDIEKIRLLLREHGAIIPAEYGPPEAEFIEPASSHPTPVSS